MGQVPTSPAARRTSATGQQSHEAEGARQRERLAPFVDQIQFLSRALRLSLLPTRTMEGLIVGSKRYALERYLAHHTLEHGELPTGRVQLRYGGDQFLKAAHAFDVGLDALATMIARDFARLALPENYRLPRHERQPFFARRIEALVSVFDDRFLTEPGPQSHRQFWFGEFLREYVEDYERLPRGKMRAASGQIPVPLSWYDFGEVDFEALRQAAGLERESDEYFHSRVAAPS